MSRTPIVPEAARTGKRTAQQEERRRHPRHLAEGQILVHWQSKFGLLRESSALLKNVSAGGFAIELDEKFPVGGVVIVETSERSLQCMVRHVQQQPHSFLVGLEVLSASDDSTCARSLEALSSALSDSFPE